MEIAYQVFYDTVDNLGRALLRNTLDFGDPSLTPPLVILDHAQILREIMAVYQSSLAGDEDANEETEEGGVAWSEPGRHVDGHRGPAGRAGDEGGEWDPVQRRALDRVGWRGGGCELKEHWLRG